MTKHVIEILGDWNPYNKIQYFKVDGKRKIPVIMESADEIKKALEEIKTGLETEDQQAEEEKLAKQIEEEKMALDETRIQQEHEEKKAVLNEIFKNWISSGFNAIYPKPSSGGKKSLGKSEKDEIYYFSEEDALKDIYGLEEKFIENKRGIENG